MSKVADCDGRASAKAGLHDSGLRVGGLRLRAGGRIRRGVIRIGFASPMATLPPPRRLRRTGTGLSLLVQTVDG
jgi:hypothetical protein